MSRRKHAISVANAKATAADSAALPVARRRFSCCLGSSALAGLALLVVRHVARPGPESARSVAGHRAAVTRGLRPGRRRRLRVGRPVISRGEGQGCSGGGEDGSGARISGRGRSTRTSWSGGARL